MDITPVLALVKISIGIISSTTKDADLTSIIDGIIEELVDEKGLTIDLAKPSHFNYVKDLAVVRYRKEEVPRYLQFRLHNMIIHNKAVSE